MSKKHAEKLLETKAWILANPSKITSEICKALRVSIRTVAMARRELMNEGLIPASRRVNRPVLKKQDIMDHLLSNKTLQDIAKSSAESKEAQDLLDSVEDFDEFDEETRKKMLRQVRIIALDPTLHPDSRLSAVNIWAKLRDLAKAKDIGPGPPRSESEILDRLVRLMQGVGPNLVVKALDKAFPKENADEDKQDSPPSGTPEVISTP